MIILLDTSAEVVLASVGDGLGDESEPPPLPLVNPTLRPMIKAAAAIYRKFVYSTLRKF